jgi:hypothetical protein
MGTQDIVTKSQPRKLRNWLRLFLRWFLAFIGGFIVGFILLITTETIDLPLLGLIIAGQQELFERLISYMFSNDARSYDLYLDISIVIHCTMWAFIVAFLTSGLKKQVRTGVAFLILYMLIGFLLYNIWMVMSIST